MAPLVQSSLDQGDQIGGLLSMDTKCHLFTLNNFR